LVEFVEAMEEMAPEEENIRLCKQAEEALDKEQFDLVIQHAQRIPRSSRRFGYASELQTVAYFRRGIINANNGNLIQGEEDLRYALKIATEADVQKRIKEQLSLVLTSRANRLAVSLKMQDAFTKKQTLKSLKTLLEEAVRLDRNNSNARESLTAVNEALSI
jgi:hypothetical protein